MAAVPGAAPAPGLAPARGAALSPAGVPDAALPLDQSEAPGPGTPRRPGAASRGSRRGRSSRRGQAPRPGTARNDDGSRAAARRGRGKDGAGRSGGGLARQLPYLIVLAGVIAGLTLIWQGQQHVRAGTLTVAGALFVAALARFALPEQRAGMLASRRRFIDVTALAILAVGLLVAGLVLPIPS